MSVSKGSIKIFPCVSRDEEHIESRLMTEQNITNIVKSILDVESFVISRESDKDNSDNYLIKFVLNGYYIEVTSQKSAAPLYASITMDTSQNIISGDVGDNFEGLSLSTTGGSLQLLDGNGNVPQTSRVKFNSKSFPTLDFGELK